MSYAELPSGLPFLPPNLETIINNLEGVNHHQKEHIKNLVFQALSNQGNAAHQFATLVGRVSVISSDQQGDWKQNTGRYIIERLGGPIQSFDEAVKSYHPASNHTASSLEQQASMPAASSSQAATSSQFSPDQQRIRDGLRQKFNDQFNKAQRHYNDNQKTALQNILNQALKDPDPWTYLKNAIVDNTGILWGEEKSKILQDNYLSLVPRNAKAGATQYSRASSSSGAASNSSSQAATSSQFSPDQQRIRDGLRQKFNDQFNKAQRHYNDNQKTALQNILNQALKDPDPWTYLNRAIEGQIGIYWGKEKSKILQTDYSVLVPRNAKTGPTQYEKASSSSGAASNRGTVSDIARSGLVCFYKSGPTEFLGNFAPCKLEVFGQNFQCAEAAFQWKKYDLIVQDPSVPRALKNELQAKMNGFFTANGEGAFGLNRELAGVCNKYQILGPKNWQDGGRDEVMWQVLQHKFAQNPEMKALLDATKPAYLLEHNQVKGRDLYWSDNLDGTGHNMLGKMLTAIRDGGVKPASESSKELNDRAIMARASDAGRIAYQIF